MSVVLILLLAAVCTGVAAYPLLARGRSADRGAGLAAELAQRLRRGRDRVYEEIRVLQQERFLGHLTEAEYQAQLGAARLRAAVLLREQERVQDTVAETTAAVEQQMARLADAPIAGGPGEPPAASPP